MGRTDDGGTGTGETEFAGVEGAEGGRGETTFEGAVVFFEEGSFKGGEEGGGSVAF